MTLEIDRLSLLAHVPGAVTILQVEKALRAESLTLGISVEDPSMSIAEWLAKGAPGAPSHFADPPDHLVAGLTATLGDGRTLEIRPGPRRAVGPDLTALVLGAGERFATIAEAWIRVKAVGARDAATPVVVPDAPLSDAENVLLAAIERELARRVEDPAD